MADVDPLLLEMRLQNEAIFVGSPARRDELARFLAKRNVTESDLVLVLNHYRAKSWVDDWRAVMVSDCRDVTKLDAVLLDLREVAARNPDALPSGVEQGRPVGHRDLVCNHGVDRRFSDARGYCHGCEPEDICPHRARWIECEAVECQAVVKAYRSQMRAANKARSEARANANGSEVVWPTIDPITKARILLEIGGQV